MHALLDRFRINPPARPEQVIIIGDFGKDLDDEHALVLAAGLQRMGLIELKAVVGNLHPARERARLAKGTLRELGFPDVPVGVGTAVFSGEQSYRYEMDVPYLAPTDDVIDDGQQLLIDTLRAADARSITLVLQSGLTDAALLCRAHKSLFRAAVKRVAIMGGVTTHAPIGVEHTDRLRCGYLQPNNANNNEFDPFAAFYLHHQLQEHAVPMRILTRDAAYACQIPFAAYSAMVATGNPIGAALLNRQQPSLQGLWRAANLPPDDPRRGTLPNDRDRAWFVSVFCDGKDPNINADGDIWPHAGRFNLYDGLNLAAGINGICRRFFQPTLARVHDAAHEIIGLSRKEHGIADADELRDFLCTVEVEALRAGVGARRT